MPTIRDEHVAEQIAEPTPMPDLPSPITATAAAAGGTLTANDAVADIAVPLLPPPVEYVQISNDRISGGTLGFEIFSGDMIAYHSERPKLNESAWKSLHTMTSSKVHAILPPDGKYSKKETS